MKIRGAEVTFEDHGEGRGKITIDDWPFKGSAGWSAMGESLFDFLLGINVEYFISNIGTHEKGQMNKKKIFANFRKQLAEELPFHREMEWQREELRPELNRIQKYSTHDDRGFVSAMSSLADSMMYQEVRRPCDREDMWVIINAACQESWNYIEYDDHPEKVYLTKMFKDIQKSIKKYQKNEN